MFKKFKIVFKIIEWVLFAVLLCLLFIVISPKLPIKNIPKSFVVVSGSMEPTIKTGSVAFTRDVDTKTIKVGDIIAFTSPSDPKDTILHRVNSISSTDPLLFKTKGDNNNDIDAWDVQDIGVKGIYITAIPYLGSIAAFIKTPLGFVLVIGIPALLFIIFQLLNIKKAISEEVDRKVSQKLKEDESQKLKNTTFKSILFFILFSATIFGLNHLAIAKALYSDTVVVSGITISIADFTKPSVPVLVSPTNDSTTTTDGLIMDWEDVINYQNPNNVYYIYRSSRVSNFSTIAGYRSSLLVSGVPAPGTPNGVYYWQVKACFSADNCSDWSEIWKVTVDSTVALKTFTLPLNFSILEFENTDSPSIDINIVSNHLANEINLEISNISSPVDIEILYTGNGVEKGIFEHVNIDEIIDSRYSKDFYFGTCTSGGTCTKEVVEAGSGITINLTGGVTFTKKFNY